MMRPNPVMTALDTDRDGAISADEMAAAPKALKTLDKNGDGILAAAEVRPGMPMGAGRPSEMVDTLFSFDVNKDGKLSKEEVPERMQGIFARADADNDGILTREELTKATATQERRGERGDGPPPDLIFRALDANQDGALSEAEIAGSLAALRTLDKNGDGTLASEEIRPPMRGGMNMDRMFEEYDADKDGKLSKTEMPGRMAEMFDRADANKDGFVSKDELRSVIGRPR